jgi:hypothetical protein
MTRRQRHNRVLVCVTIAFFVFAGVILVRDQDLRTFLIACGSYAAFLLVYSLICWFEVPKQLRGRPDMPAGYGALELGVIRPAVARLLEASEVTRDQVFGRFRHQLYCSERRFPEGVWRCEVEVSDNRVLAWATSFESVESPVLDRGKQEGEGRFLVVPG